MSIEKLNPFFSPTYENFPRGRTIALLTGCFENLAV